MDKQIEDLFTYGLYGIMTITLLFMIFFNMKNPWIILILSSVFLLIFTLNYIILDNSLLLFIEILLISIIGICDKGTSYTVFYYCVGINTIIRKGKGKGFLVFFISYISFIVTLFYKMNGQVIWIITLRAIYNILGFITVYTAAIILSYVLKQNIRLSKVTKELRLKTLEQQETYNKLLEVNKQLEELAVIKERNRITREIHDTIGHKLTTAIVEIEAGKTIFPRQKEEALNKFLMAQEQIKKCLNDVRGSVKTLAINETADFVEAVIKLIEDTERHTAVRIKYNIETLQEDIPQDIFKTLYRVVQEGLTNGIKHGQSTIFVLNINKDANTLRLNLQDNGKGCSCIVKGFGIKSMEERVAEVNGTIVFESEAEEGFGINISIPI